MHNVHSDYVNSNAVIIAKLSAQQASLSVGSDLGNPPIQNIRTKFLKNSLYMRCYITGNA